MNALTLEGHYRDRLTGPGGRLVADSGWRKNLIVLPCRVLLAGFLKNDPAHGIRSLQVGRGSTSWDATPPPPPDPNNTDKLFDPSPFVVPLAKLAFEYLDPADGVSAAPTNRIQVTATLGPGEPTAAGAPPYPLREFGLFAELNGTPRMIDYIRHPLIQKDGATTLERRVRLVF